MPKITYKCCGDSFNDFDKCENHIYTKHNIVTDYPYWYKKREGKQMEISFYWELVCETCKRNFRSSRCNADLKIQKNGFHITKIWNTNCKMCDKPGKFIQIKKMEEYIINRAKMLLIKWMNWDSFPNKYVEKNIKGEHMGDKCEKCIALGHPCNSKEMKQYDEQTILNQLIMPTVHTTSVRKIVQAMPTQNLEVKSVQKLVQAIPTQNLEVKSVQKPVQVMPKQKSMQAMPKQKLEIKSVQKSVQVIPKQKLEVKPVQKLVQAMPKQKSVQAMSKQKLEIKPVQKLAQTIPTQNLEIKPVQKLAQTMPTQNLEIKPVQKLAQTMPTQNLEIKPVQKLAQTMPMQNLEVKSVQNLEVKPVQNLEVKPVQKLAQTMPMQNLEVKPVQKLMQTMPTEQIMSNQPQLNPINDNERNGSVLYDMTFKLLFSVSILYVLFKL